MECFYLRRERRKDFFMLAFYVDDFFLTSNSTELLANIKRGMKENNKMSDLGTLS
jgi:hypothetical protein